MRVLKLFLVPLVLCNLSFANEKNSTLDKYISTYKKEQFDYDYAKNDAEASKLHDSWIAPIRLNYNYSKSNPNDVVQTYQSAGIKIDQPIFSSGGIYYGVKFANASKLYADYATDALKRKMIKDAVSILMQIKELTLKEQKQKLQIQNSQVNLLQKKEEYLNGQLDSGFLNNAIIQRNILKQALFDIQTAKEKLISKFQALSDMPYDEAPIPKLEFLSSDEFLKHNISLKMSKAKILKSRYSKDMTISKYLPKVNVVAGYNWNKSENNIYSFGSNERDYYDYGFKVSIPLDINTFRDIESARVDYLKAEVLQKDKKRELDAVFKQVMHNIENFNKKIEFSDENIDLYAKLLEETKELYEAGYKTKYDVEILNNSLKIQEIDSKIFEMDKQLELLTLYEMYINNGK
ncbi:MAG: TolC family protein [Epsilonproteobacteria bacterium]|nr:TolC family protein [Campylobacterota bacterium]